MELGFVVERQTGVLQLNGQLDFSRNVEFRRVVGSMLDHPDVREVRVDLQRVDFLDSSGLGLLLLLREDAEASGRPVRLSGASTVVRRVLEIARFDRLFELR